MIVEDLITAAGAQSLPENGLLAGGVYALADAGDKSLTVPGGVEASLVVVHTRQDESKLSIELLDAASLSVVVLFAARAQRMPPYGVDALVGRAGLQCLVEGARSAFRYERRIRAYGQRARPHKG